MAYETLLLSDKATLVLEKLDGKKIRVSSSSWSDPKVILEYEVIEARVKTDGIRTARKNKDFGPSDQPIEPYDPYGAGLAKAAPNDVRARPNAVREAGPNAVRARPAGR